MLHVLIAIIILTTGPQNTGLTRVGCYGATEIAASAIADAVAYSGVGKDADKLSDKTGAPPLMSSLLKLDTTPVVDKMCTSPITVPVVASPITKVDKTCTSPITASRITVSFAGDCTLGYDESFQYKYSFPYRLENENNDYSYFFRNVKPIFEADDLTLVNLETTLTDAAKKAQKKFHFKGDPSYVNILTEGSIEMVNISNNHIYDYLQEGFEDTLETLDKAGIMYCGEGRIAYYEAKGTAIACLGYKGWDIAIMEKIKKDLTAAAQTSDIIIVSFHWGDEYSFYPNETQKKLGRFCIDTGADIVIGHHPHVIQGIEKYKDGYIAYSLGNFCFGGNINPNDKDTFIFQIVFTFENNKITALKPVIIPCSISSTDSINNYQPTILEGERYEKVMDRLMEYSSTLEWGISLSDLQSL